LTHPALVFEALESQLNIVLEGDLGELDGTVLSMTGADQSLLLDVQVHNNSKVQAKKQTTTNQWWYFWRCVSHFSYIFIDFLYFSFRRTHSISIILLLYSYVVGIFQQSLAKKFPSG